MKPPHHMAHVGLEVEHFPVNRRLIPNNKQWVLGTVIECPAERCRWTLGLAKELLQVLGDAASEHLEDEQKKHEKPCREDWKIYDTVEKQSRSRTAHGAYPVFVPEPICGCGKPAQEQPEEQ